MDRHIRQHPPLRLRKRPRHQVQARQRDDHVAQAPQPVDQHPLYGFITHRLPLSHIFPQPTPVSYPQIIAPTFTLDATHLVRLHADATALWHTAPGDAPATTSPLYALALAQHRANFDLWHQEDAARDHLATDATITHVKHAIDALNQQRNDLVEQLDTLLIGAVQQNPNAPLHSETPGLIIDRLSILALKAFHTEEQLHRSTPAHQARNRDRLALLTAQRDDLAACLHDLWSEIIAGTRRFKLYRQLKMYNDPELNPVLYTKST